MTVLYLLAEGSHFAGAVLFSGCFEPQYQLRQFGTLGQLLAVLEEEKHKEKAMPLAAEQERHHVVVLSLPVEKVQSAVLQVKSVFPEAVCVSVLEAREEKDAKLADWDCLFIQRPLNEFYVKSTVAAAIRQSKLLYQMSRIGQYDEQTGLYNHRYFMSRLSEELALARRHKESLACIVFGVCYYEMFLDSYGYDFIHILYKHLARIVQEHTRKEDIIAKIGDQEIGLLLPRSSEAGAKILAGRIIESVSSKPLQYRAEEEGICLYAGIFGYPQPEDMPIDADSVVRYARHALHHAQRQANSGQPAQLFNELYPVE